LSVSATTGHIGRKRLNFPVAPGRALDRIRKLSCGAESVSSTVGQFQTNPKIAEAGALSLERMRKLGGEFLGLPQDLEFPLQIGIEEIALRFGYPLERFGSAHHKRGTRLVGSTERPGWE